MLFLIVVVLAIVIWFWALGRNKPNRSPEEVAEFNQNLSRTFMEGIKIIDEKYKKP